MKPLPNAHASRWRRLGWLLLIWALSVGAAGLLAGALRVLLNAIFA